MFLEIVVSWYGSLVMCCYINDVVKNKRKKPMITLPESNRNFLFLRCGFILILAQYGILEEQMHQVPRLFSKWDGGLPGPGPSGSEISLAPSLKPQRIAEFLRGCHLLPGPRRQLRGEIQPSHLTEPCRSRKLLR